MDTEYSPSEIAFRQEVQDFLRVSLPAEMSTHIREGRKLTKKLVEGWHTILRSKGWGAPTWPAEFGGTGWSPVQRHIFEEECCYAFAPRILPFSFNMLGPVIQKFGNDTQKAEILPRILDGTDWWCQGYSEPGSGSDLASLKTRADRDGDHYVVNGQKTWTTLGQHANRIFCLVRTDFDCKPQAGISFLLIDLDTPGVDMRPIKLLDGSLEVNEVFFTDVRVPVENLVGAENQGWTIAKFLLTHERTNIAGVGYATQELARVKGLAERTIRNGKPVIQDPTIALDIARLETDLAAMRLTNLRMLYKAEETGAPGPETSILKIKGTVIRQALNDLARRILGPLAAAHVEPDAGIDGLLSDESHSAATYFNLRKLSIYGGSNEIQRNILSKAMLEL